MRLLVLGNSIALHGPKPDIGWTGNWGMAASAEDRDFVHVLASELEKAGMPVTLRVRNAADFERDPSLPVEEYFAGDLAFSPEVAVLRLSENTPGELYEAFAEAYGALIRRLRQDPRCRVTAVGPFWENPRMEALLKAQAEENGAAWVSLSHLHSEAYRAVGQFGHAGVASHPSDKGMRAIAEAVLASLRREGLLS